MDIFSICAEEDIWKLALALVENSEVVKQSTAKKNRPGKKKRVKRKAEELVKSEPSVQAAIPPEIIAMLEPMITFRSVSQDSKGFISRKDVIDVFYSILDVVNKSDASQNAMEDTLRVMRSKMVSIEDAGRIFGLEMCWRPRLNSRSRQLGAHQHLQQSTARSSMFKDIKHRSFLSKQEKNKP